MMRAFRLEVQRAGAVLGFAWNRVSTRGQLHQSDPLKPLDAGDM
jgi:hypothetical protein